VPERADWDIVSGVGVTAVGAAAARAIESRHDRPLVTDPYADAFVRAANTQLPAPMPASPEEAAADPEVPYASIAQHIGVRSRFIDGYFGGAMEAGIRQAVILAAGLDTRAFRLDWPAGAAVYEADRATVLGFKDAVLGEVGARARCDRRTVSADLREDWPAALEEAGFDASAPTAWLAEGLFMYLIDEVIEALLSHVHRLSAPGSRIMIEHLRPGAEAMHQAGAQAVAERVDSDVAGLWAAERNHDPVPWLRARGWTVQADSVADLSESYGRAIRPADRDLFRAGLLITATRD
jgi:methyltransferase (TIGR00027 family)